MKNFLVYFRKLAVEPQWVVSPTEKFANPEFDVVGLLDEKKTLVALRRPHHHVEY